MVDSSKLKEIQKEITELKKYHKKLSNLKAKHFNKGKKKEVVSDTETEAAVEEADVMDNMKNAMVPEMEDKAINESFLKMQKIAGLIK